MGILAKDLNNCIHGSDIWAPSYSISQIFESHEQQGFVFACNPELLEHHLDDDKKRVSIFSRTEPSEHRYPAEQALGERVTEWRRRRRPRQILSWSPGLISTVISSTTLPHFFPPSFSTFSTMLAVDSHIHPDSHGDANVHVGEHKHGLNVHSPSPKRPRLLIETHTLAGHLPSPPPTAHPSPPLSPSTPSLESLDLPPVVNSPSSESPKSPRTPRVHFRSRVHIASRIPHSRTHKSRSRSPPWHHHRLSDGLPSPAAPSSPGSGPSSPSSSISVPLRPADSDAVSTSPLWGPLGRRVQLFASRRQRGLNGHNADLADPEEDQIRDGYTDPYYPFNGRAYSAARGERTPLIKTVLRPSAYGTKPRVDWRADLFSSEYDRYVIAEQEEGERARLNREIDLFFGTWPGRLLNYRWWWWHSEPFLCWLCLEEAETVE